MANYPFRNLVFEGGGVKGIAYVGALRELRERKVLESIDRVGGTSAGAINAVLLAIGLDVEEVESLLWTMNFEDFKDDSWGVIRDTSRLVNEYGWHKGNAFRNWIADQIGQVTGNRELTFAQLDSLRKTNNKMRELFLIGTNLSTGFAEKFCARTTPRVCIADAARISMSIPLFFRSIRSPRGDCYVDGGVLDNYPVKLFDREKYIETPEHRRHTDYYQKHNGRLTASGRQISPYCYNMETLGFRLDSAREIAVFRDQSEPPRREIDSFVDYTRALINTIYSTQDNQHLHDDDWQRTVYIDTLGVKTTEFEISDSMKNALIRSGADGVKKYFEWFDDPTSNPVNDPSRSADAN